MADIENNTDLQEIFRASLEEAKKKARAKSKKREEEEEGEEEEEEEEEGGHRKMEEARREEEEEEDSTESEREQGWSKTNKVSGKRDEKDDEKAQKGKKRPAAYGSVKEDTLSASTLKPAARSVSDSKALTKSKIGMMTGMMHMMNGMGKSDMVDFFNKVIGLYGPNKNWGVDNWEGKNEASIRMNPSHAVSSKGPSTNMPMPKLNVKEDVEEMFDGQDLSEEFKEKASTLFEAAISARLIAESARLEEEFEARFNDELYTFTEEVTNKLDTYLDYVVENWMTENEVAIESSLRNELSEEFMDGLKNLFAEHYIDVPQQKVDVLEALADKVNALESKLDETITENTELKGFVLENHKNEILEEISSDLALTQQEKFAALVEGIEFDGDLNTYARKLMIVKENYFNKSTTSYSSNIEEETFEGDIENTNGSGSRFVDPQVNRYVQAIAKTVKK